MRLAVPVYWVCSLILAACEGHTQQQTPPPAPPPVAQSEAARPDPTPPKLRLPKMVVPVREAVAMNLSPARAEFSGRADIGIEIREPTDVIWLHALDLKITKAEITGARVVKIVQPEELLGLVLDHPLAASATLHLEYTGKLPSRDGRGAYRQEETGEWYIFTQFESTDARRAFPCFDEPSFKIPWRISIDAPERNLVFANTPETKHEGEHHEFAETRPLPSYLVAFAVGPFEVVDAGKAGRKPTPIRIIVPKGKSAEAAYAANVTGDILKRLEDYFDIPYPYEKLDHIAVPQKGGAMENPGLITFGTSTMLGKPDEKSIRLERGYVGIASHELGHIWTGDFVTTAWWDDIWLNEAFATWISAKITDEMHPEWDGKVSRVQSRNGIMGNDSLVTARRIRQPIESKHDIANAFDGITYQKGAAVIAMFEHFVGPDAFRKGVHNYLLRHAYGNATATDFLTDVHTNVAPAFATFLDQPGFPLVMAETSCTGSAKLLLSQQRYVPQGSSGASEETWQIPICARWPGGKACTLMTEGHAEVDLGKTCPAWVLANADYAGYYRVQYKGDGLAKLLKDGGKQLTIAERVGLFGDVLALVRSGQLHESDALALVPALTRDGNRHLVGMALGLVGGLSDHLVEDSVRPNYRRLITKLFGARAHQLGWQPKADEDDDTRLLRSQLVATVAEDGEDKALLGDARKLAEKWLSDRKAIAPDMVGSVLGAAAHSGDRALWEKFHTAAKAEKERRERGRLLSAMSGFRDPSIVQENFKIALSDQFDPRESLSLVYGAGGDPRTRQMAWDFVKQHYEDILARMPKDFGGRLVGVGGGFCDAEHRAEIEAFFKDRVTKSPGGPRQLAQMLEGQGLCIAMRSAQLPSVTSFLKKY
jgi:alanyl aminopeptidase